MDRGEEILAQLGVLIQAQERGAAALERIAVALEGLGDNFADCTAKRNDPISLPPRYISTDPGC